MAKKYGNLKWEETSSPFQFNTSAKKCELFTVVSPLVATWAQTVQSLWAGDLNSVLGFTSFIHPFALANECLLCFRHCAGHGGENRGAALWKLIAKGKQDLFNHKQMSSCVYGKYFEWKEPSALTFSNRGMWASQGGQGRLPWGGDNWAAVWKMRS